jgi:hypothetical protein
MSFTIKKLYGYHPLPPDFEPVQFRPKDGETTKSETASEAVSVSSQTEADE